MLTPKLDRLDIMQTKKLDVGDVMPTIELDQNSYTLTHLHTN